MTVVLHYNYMYLQDIKYCSKSVNRFVRKSNSNKLHTCHFTVHNYPSVQTVHVQYKSFTNLPHY